MPKLQKIIVIILFFSLLCFMIGGTFWQAHVFGATYPDINPFALQTQSATNISDTTATLNGEITELGGNSYAAVKFEYGQVGSATNTFSDKVIYAPGLASRSLSNLLPNTTYRFQIKAAAGIFTWEGGMLEFTTTGAEEEGGEITPKGITPEEEEEATPPSVQTNSATNITGTTARLNGTLTKSRQSVLHYLLPMGNHDNIWAEQNIVWSFLHIFDATH